ncbi:uncharacterized protein LOC119494372 [Sebastes umbrosus]|uniref:uncharacterized protein LOC119494372 n=1 Tax=Sebastes umbrosus TaxID=72105 RepID=UPI00189F3245|nr:uncharacterized protein LOC119494372 [Sebastes umbrosus]
MNPLVITETETVTLDCQTASSVPVSRCYFYTLSGGLTGVFSCLQTLTGTELLKMARQSPPAEVEVKCYYTVDLGEKKYSPDSDTSSITIQPSLQPKLTVNPPVITETDSVTLICQTPSSVPVSQCYFYILSGGTVNSFSCRQTLTGTKLLLLADQNSPAEVKLKCYYIVKRGEKNDPSPHSDASSITIRSLTVTRPHASTLVTPVKRTSDWTVGTPSSTGSFISTFLTSVKPASGNYSVFQ